MLLQRIHHGFVCIFNRSPSHVKRGFGPLRLWYTAAMKPKNISLAPLKFKEAVSDLLKVKPESKPKNRPKATTKAK